jgi:ubiquitin C-terminal hydrolase
MNGICGLGNIGNSCYVNATLQVLSQINELNDYLFTLKKLKDIPEAVIVLEWMGLIKMIRENHSSILPYRFMDQMRKISTKKNREEFSTHEQNDSADFFVFMLECFHNALNHIDTFPMEKSGCIQVDQYIQKNRETDSSIVSKLFISCTLNQYINPVTKKLEFYKLEHDYTIGLSIPEKKIVNIHDCFVESFKEESLHGENAWFDEKENTKKSVLKRSALAYLPTILCLHLKRWRDDLSKKTTKVDSPLLLDMTKFSIYKEKQLYELFAIINHEGRKDCGHYYSYVLRDKTWFLMNDESVQSVSSDTIIHESNYCLFYRKIK